MTTPSPQLPPSLLRFVWSHRRSFAPGLGISILRILTIAPLPLAFQRILDVYLPARDERGIVLVFANTIVLLVIHHVCSVRGAELLATSVSRDVLDLRGLIIHKVQFLSFG